MQQTAVIIPFPTKLTRREWVRNRLDELIAAVMPYYGTITSGLIDDLNRVANGKTGISAALRQIEWLESELEAYRELDEQDAE